MSKFWGCRPSVSFGLSVSPLEWLLSFLTDRTHYVITVSSRSSRVPALFSVPQGSVLGPLHYLQGGYFLSDAVLWSPAHDNADEIQAYVRYSAADAVDSVGLICFVVDALSRWMALKSSTYESIQNPIYLAWWM